MLFVCLIGLPFIGLSVWLLLNFLGSRSERSCGWQAVDAVCMLIQIGLDVLSGW
jgi:hypothetical protein